MRQIQSETQGKLQDVVHINCEGFFISLTNEVLGGVGDI